MTPENGPWGDRYPPDNEGDRRRMRRPSGAAVWVVIALGVWAAIIAIAALIFLT